MQNITHIFHILLVITLLSFCGTILIRHASDLSESLNMSATLFKLNKGTEK